MGEVRASVVRVCENCGGSLTSDFSVPGCEWRCPYCGRREEYFGKTALAALDTPTEPQP